MTSNDEVVAEFKSLVIKSVSDRTLDAIWKLKTGEKMLSEMTRRDQSFSDARPCVCDVNFCFDAISTGPSDEVETLIKPLWAIFSTATTRSLIDHYYRGESTAIDNKIPQWIEEGSRIVSASVLLSNGLVICSPRHFDNTMRSVCQHGSLNSYVPGSEQGFVDQFGRFFNRKQALLIAKAQGQLVRKTQPEDELFSEDLY